MAEAWGEWGVLFGPVPEAGRRREAGKAGWGSVSQFWAVPGPLLYEVSMERRERRLWRLLGLG